MSYRVQKAGKKKKIVGDVCGAWTLLSQETDTHGTALQRKPKFLKTVQAFATSLSPVFFLSTCLSLSPWLAAFFSLPYPHRCTRRNGPRYKDY